MFPPVFRIFQIDALVFSGANRYAVISPDPSAGGLRSVTAPEMIGQDLRTLRMHCGGYLRKPLTPEKTKTGTARLRDPVKGI